MEHMRLIYMHGYYYCNKIANKNDEIMILDLYYSTDVLSFSTFGNVLEFLARHSRGYLRHAEQGAVAVPMLLLAVGGG